MEMIRSDKGGVNLVGIKDAARLLSISTSTLYGWVWQRRIPFVKIGRAVRFDMGDLETFIRVNRRSATTT
jgi:excisionase family DNA binding protein